MPDKLLDVTLDDTIEIPEEWLDLSGVALGFDVLDKPGEVALLVIMPEPQLPLGLSFDPDGAVALANALHAAAEGARAG